MFGPTMFLKGAPGAGAPDLPQNQANPTAASLATSSSRLLCAVCQAFVTESRTRLEMSGAFCHTFINAAGVIYRIGCFASAAGTRALGEESTHFTWFPGFAWQVAICRNCCEHLGWAFRSADSDFFGLILERLIECHEPAEPPS